MAEHQTCIRAPRPSLVRHGFVALAFAAALFAGACVETRLNRVLKTPDQVQTLDHRSAYLKAHMKDGRLYVLSKWHVDDATRQVTGDGESFNPAREMTGSARRS